MQAPTSATGHPGLYRDAATQGHHVKTGIVTAPPGFTETQKVKMRRQEYVSTKGMRHNLRSTEVEMSNLPDKEYKVMIIKMLTVLRGSRDEFTKS